MADDDAQGVQVSRVSLEDIKDICVYITRPGKTDGAFVGSVNHSNEELLRKYAELIDYQKGDKPIYVTSEKIIDFLDSISEEEKAEAVKDRKSLSPLSYLIDFVKKEGSKLGLEFTLRERPPELLETLPTAEEAGA